MIQSLKRYIRLFFITFFLKKEKLILFNHFFDYYISRKYKRAIFSTFDKQKALRMSIDWLLLSQKNSNDGGMGTYYIVDGWTSSYPETSGYIIPTLYESLDFFPERKLEIEMAIYNCADWLVSIQKPSGGWQSHYINHNRPEVVFNTGQVLRGLLIAYKMSGDKKYLDSLCKACDWLTNIQEEDGSWIKMASMGVPRVYDTYVAHPILMVYEVTGNEKYKVAAIKNLNWVLTQQQPNGWFKNADNTQKHNDRPILHTISYTIDGLLNAGLILKDQRYIDAGRKAADQVLNFYQQHKYLNGRFDFQWMGTEYMICTGVAQISIIWSILWELTHETKYLDAIKQVNNQLVYIQQSCLTIQGKGNGAIPGSYPIWGKYEPFGFPNWATKYFADALMAELKYK